MFVFQLASNIYIKQRVGCTGGTFLSGSLRYYRKLEVVSAYKILKCSLKIKNTEKLLFTVDLRRLAWILQIPSCMKLFHCVLQTCNKCFNNFSVWFWQHVTQMTSTYHSWITRPADSRCWRECPLCHHSETEKWEMYTSRNDNMLQIYKTVFKTSVIQFIFS